MKYPRKINPNTVTLTVEFGQAYGHHQSEKKIQEILGFIQGKEREQLLSEQWELV